MKLVLKIALVTGALALACASAALAAKPADVPKGAANGNGPNYTPGEPTPGPKDGLPAQAKAYGRYCQGKSRKHVKGQKGTEFSQCVKTMAQAAKQEHKSPGQICKGKSKKHVKGEKGTEFSECVKAVAQMRRDERRKEREEAAV